MFAAPFRLNGNGEVTGLQWMRESGLLTTPIALTNTHSVGAVHEALVAAALEGDRSTWSLPVVAETWDGVLNDVNGFHVRPEHARAALDSARRRPRPGGERRRRHGDDLPRLQGRHRHVLAGCAGRAHRRRARPGEPRDASATDDRRRARGPHDRRRTACPCRPAQPLGEGVGSIVVVVATDAPLLPHQCERLALRAMLGVARVGGAGETSSGDFALAFSTGPTRQVEPCAERGDEPALLCRDRGDRGGDRQRAARRRDDDRPRRRRPSTRSTPSLLAEVMSTLDRSGRACPARRSAAQTSRRPRYGPTRRKKMLPGSVPCVWPKNAPKSFPADASPS